jgi:hypothetical protein
MSDGNCNIGILPRNLEDSARRQAIALLERGKDLPVDLLCQLLPTDLALPILVYPGKRGREEILRCTFSANLRPVHTYGETGHST